MLCAKSGKIYKLPDVMGVYRWGSGTWSTKPDCYRQLVWLSVLNQIRMQINENKEAVEVIDAQIHDLQNSILINYQGIENRWYQIYSSHAYRLGKFILKPFRLMTQFLFK